MSEKTSLVAVLVHALIFGTCLYFLKQSRENFQNGVMQTMMASNPNNLNQKKEGFGDFWSVFKDKYILMATAWALMIFWYLDFNIMHIGESVPFSIITIGFPMLSILLAVIGFAVGDK